MHLVVAVHDAPPVKHKRSIGHNGGPAPKSNAARNTVAGSAAGNRRKCGEQWITRLVGWQALGKAGISGIR
jgi:hypothetical protein